MMNGAHIHLILSHLPVVGSLAASLLLIVGIAKKSHDIQWIGLISSVAVAVAAGGAFLSGEPAEQIVEHLPAAAATAQIEAHEEAAEVTLALAVLSGAF